MKMIIGLITIMVAFLSACDAEAYTVSIGTPPTIPDEYYERQQPEKVVLTEEEVCLNVGKTVKLGDSNVSLLSISESVAFIAINGMILKNVSNGGSICSGFRLSSVFTDGICATRTIRQ